MTFIPEQRDQKTAFGELETAEGTPVVQIQFPYNINSRVVESRENNSGTVTQASSMAVVQSGASANSGATMLSRIPIKYNPGQGAEARFTALFTTGVANSEQLAGPIFPPGDGLAFGYNGTAFGVLRRDSGSPEIQTLSVTNPADVVGGNITITLDSQATVVAVALNDTAREVAVKIANTDFADAGAGWSAVVNNATVVFTAWTDGDKSGTFSFVDTDTTGVAASLAETVAGAASTDAWVAQANWNVDVFDSTGPSGMTLDPTNLNVYQIEYQFLGGGALTFSVENSETGQFQEAHRIKYANTATAPSMQNPTLPICFSAINTSNTSNLTVKTSSMAGFVQGKNTELSLLGAADASNASVTTTEIPILSIKNRSIHQSVINRVEVKPGEFTLATEGTKSVTFRGRLNPTLTGTPAFADFDANTSVVAIDTAASGLTGGDLILPFPLGRTDSKELFNRQGIKLMPGDILTISAEATSGTQEVAIGLNWQELI